MVLSRPLSSYPCRFYREGLHLVVVGVRRNPRSALDPSLKTSNLLNLRLAFMEARRRGADDALLLNYDEDVAEASGSNVFAVIGGRLLTPPVETGILQGITRGFVMDLAARERGGTWRRRGSRCPAWRRPLRSSSLPRPARSCRWPPSTAGRWEMGSRDR